MQSDHPLSQEQKHQLREQEVEDIFADYEAKTNFVGLYDLLLKIDRRENPQLYD